MLPKPNCESGFDVLNTPISLFIINNSVDFFFISLLVTRQVLSITCSHSINQGPLITDGRNSNEIVNCKDCRLPLEFQK